MDLKTLFMRFFRSFFIVLLEFRPLVYSRVSYLLKRLRWSLIKHWLSLAHHLAESSVGKSTILWQKQPGCGDFLSWSHKTLPVTSNETWWFCTFWLFLASCFFSYSLLLQKKKCCLRMILKLPQEPMQLRGNMFIASISTKFPTVPKVFKTELWLMVFHLFRVLL